MKLDVGNTTITLSEQKVEHASLSTYAPLEESVYWEASLYGEDEQTGAEVSMSRNGKTPDAALKALFEAMGDAGVTL